MHLYNYNKNARSAINKLIKIFKTVSLEQIADNFNITIEEVSNMKKTGKIRGNTIYIREDLPPDLKIFIVAHELGHRIMHFSDGACYNFSTDKTTKEKEANDFALLLLALHYQTPADVIKMKLNELYKLKL